MNSYEHENPVYNEKGKATPDSHQLEADLAIIARLWCFPVGYKQFYATPTSDKATPNMREQDKNKETAIMIEHRNKNTVQTTKYDQTSPS